MGYNTNTFDQKAHWAKKTIKQLEHDLKRAQEFVANYPKFEHGMHNEYIANLKLTIAERIGRK